MSINKRILNTAILNLFLLISISGSSQSFFGLYRGGNCTGESLNCGWWYLKQDSSFVFINEDKLGRIKNIGIGKWTFLSDSSINFLFNDDPELQLNTSTLSYTATTKENYDSAYFELNLFDNNNTPIKYASIKIGTTNKTAKTDAKGYCKFTIPANWNVTHLSVIKRIEDFYPLKLYLSPNYNHHQINAIVPKIDSLSSFYVDRTSLKYTITKKKLLRSWEITKVSDNVSVIIKILKNSKRKQPLLSTQIDYLMNLLQK